MKSKLTLLIAILMTSIISQAQISAGFVYGVNTSSFAGQSDDQVEYKNGNRFGIALNFAVLDNFSIEPQFLVTKKGAKIRNNSPVNVTLNYAELPVLFNVRIPLGNKIFPNVFGGPYIASKIGNNEPIPWYETTDEVEAEIQEVNIKKFDAGFSYGVGVDYRVERFFIGLNARVDQGFARIGSNEFTPDLKNKSYSLNAIIGFVLVK